MDIPTTTVQPEGADDEIQSSMPRINPKEMLELKQTRIYTVVKYIGKVQGTGKNDQQYTRYSWLLQDDWSEYTLTNFDFFYKDAGKHKNSDMVGKKVKLTPYNDKKVALEIL